MTRCLHGSSYMWRCLQAVIALMLSSIAHAKDLPALADYEGKYPHEATILPGFLDHPLVRDAAATILPRADIRRLVLDSPGPRTPIWIEADRIHAWGCEAHYCGPHNWMISLRLDGRAPEICYYRAGSEDAGARWYTEEGSDVRKPHCPSGPTGP